MPAVLPQRPRIQTTCVGLFPTREIHNKGIARYERAAFGCSNSGGRGKGFLRHDRAPLVPVNRLHLVLDHVTEDVALLLRLRQLDVALDHRENRVVGPTVVVTVVVVFSRFWGDFAADFRCMAAAMGQLEFDGAAGSPGAFGDAERSLVIVGGVCTYSILVTRVS